MDLKLFVFVAFFVCMSVAYDTAETNDVNINDRYVQMPGDDRYAQRVHRKKFGSPTKSTSPVMNKPNPPIETKPQPTPDAFPIMIERVAAKIDMSSAEALSIKQEEVKRFIEEHKPK